MNNQHGARQTLEGGLWHSHDEVHALALEVLGALNEAGRVVLAAVGCDAGGGEEGMVLGYVVGWGGVGWGEMGCGLRILPRTHAMRLAVRTVSATPHSRPARSAFAATATPAGGREGAGDCEEHHLLASKKRVSGHIFKIHRLQRCLGHLDGVIEGTIHRCLFVAATSTLSRCQGSRQRPPISSPCGRAAASGHKLHTLAASHAPCRSRTALEAAQLRRAAPIPPCAIGPRCTAAGSRTASYLSGAIPSVPCRQP
jgi:hypothetical protein